MYNEDSKLIVVDIEQEMKKSFLDYSMSVIVARALPDVRDGLKPVHRRILYTMYENGLYPEKAYRKCADTVGTVLGRYHPHGDASVYDALVRLAQDFSLRYPLVDGHGNFGSVDGDPAAAYRYTESRMAKMAMPLLTDIDKETVDFTPNYDDRILEPSVLPSRYPNLLVNGSTGIAVGMATNIPPHNLREVIDAACCLIDNPDATLDDLMEHVKGPDFPTAGIIMGRKGIRSAYATGRGRIILRARAEIEELKNGRERIVVTEIPYMVNKSRLIENMAELVKDKRIEMISDLRDESDRDGMRIVVELKKEANAQIVLNQLYSYTQMQETVGVIMLCIVDGVPKELTLKEMLHEYIKFQEEVIVRRTKFDLRKAQDREHILQGLKIAQDNIDEVISIIRSSRDNNESKPRLMERFGLTEIQASAIIAMRLGQLAGLEREKIENELAEIMAKIAEYEAILSDENKVLQIIKEEITAIKDKFGDERRTEIMAVSGEVDIEDLIPVEDCVITLTHFGYLKRMAMDVYKTQRRGGRGISGMTRRDEDFVEELFICSTHDYVMFFSNMGRVYRLKGYEIAECSRTSRGTNIINLLPLEQGEKITSMIKVGEYDDDKYLVMVTRQGTVKRSQLSLYKNVRKGGLIAISLDEGDELAWVRETNGENEMIIATRMGMAIRFKETDLRPLGRNTRGVRAISLKEGDEVVGMARTREGATILTITEKGSGRRTEIDEYRLQNRGGKGILNYKCNEEKGLVAGIKVVDDDDDVIMITDDGVIIRISVDEINKQSRYAGGVRVMRVADGGRIVTLARAPKEDVDDDEIEDELDGETGEAQQNEPENIGEDATEAAEEIADVDEEPEE
ncbi:DNA gyrase subunit A [Hydrogenoanaerobacterium saccharovorans]|uniref:DNA gyrase subunit A n=1 Tax=Hydrogenoanaerobacterium saccharovorans TaxID=474960 RepID=A0A1H8CIW0_9FIRM|nr:DNA gyrase subunit A [Hydrogenoanaerobacterium saccharovorans]RPF43146.1 DNA gyrase subunit A [Hydrogenoanaerobacterium saccharovorans]SEM95043.1 DNA gyrase subunit A [Hydrogenoanaerobacterium saccharovorans]